MAYIPAPAKPQTSPDWPPPPDHVWRHDKALWPWLCLHCHTVQPAERTDCRNCGTPKPAPEIQS